MTSEFKKIKNNEDTHYVLETATSGATSAGVVATAPGKRREDSILAQEKKETPKPRNFVAKNAKMGGAGKMKDKSKTIPRKEKHKKPVAEDHRDNPMYGQDADFDNMLLRREARRKGMTVAQYKNYLEKQKQDQDHELNIGSAGRAELKQKADELAEIKREKLRNERLHDEETAFQRAETGQQRKDEMQKIADKYKHDLTVIDKEHRNNMEAIRTGNSHETNKMSMEFQHEKEMWDRNNPQQKPQSNFEKPIPEPEQEPEDNRGNNFDQDTGATLKPQSNQWHTSQQVGYKPTKPTKPSNNDDIVDVEPKPNKPLALKEKITVVKDPAKATGIQQTGGITHGSVYAGKPIKQPYRITPGATYTPGKPLPQSLQQKLDGKTNTGRAVDAKGRTQQQWLKLVKAKFPDAKIMQAKMMDGPVHAMLPDGRKLSWNKVEQGVAEGVAETMPMRDAQQVLNHYGADYFKTTHDTLYFSKYRKQFSIDRIRDDDSASAGSVSLSDLNNIVRKLRDMRVPLSPFGEGVSDLSYDAQSLITKLRRDVEEKRLKPTAQAVLAAARELAGDMDFAPQLLVKQVLGQGVAEGFNGEYDDEAGMAHTNLLTSARAVMGLLKTIEDKDNLPEWVQEKIAKAEMMLVGVWDYLQSQKEQGIDPQVEGFGKMRGSSSAYDRDYASSVSGMGRGNNHRDDERHDLDPSDWYIVKDGKMYKTSVYPRQEQEAIARGYSRTKEEAKSKADSVAEGVDPYFESLRAKVEELAKK